ncbi:unnamed protein product [Peronospora belbahrii]|uniref:Uncharacterized protein n=1 Tax=Peronospora belbahrii TaxID=622444 RepID=A0AAU9KQI1_9STRA|nr:unnamed protein product [Peronospora belbahrii]
MLRRHPTRVEEQADVAAEYEAYLQEKEHKLKTKSKTTQNAASSFSTASDSMRARQEARRQEVRSRIGLDNIN